jgi:hypothetical protein
MSNPVYDFLKELIDLMTVKFSGKGVMPQTEDSADAYKWLLEQSKDQKNKRVAVHKDPVMHNGKIYIFKYMAKHKDRLAYWDRHPILLFLGYVPGAEGKLAVGLNISWYPPDARKWIVEKIRLMYKEPYTTAMKKNPNDAIAQKPVIIDLYTLKQALDTFGLSFALRTYILGNMINPKLCLSYEDWDKAVRLDQPRIFPELETKGLAIDDIYKLFRDYVTNYKENIATKKAIMNKNKKLQKYNFIK